MMGTKTRNLEILHHLLDQDLYPVIMEGGIIKMPDELKPSPTNQGMETVDGYSTRRSKARSRERSPRWEGPSDRSWSTSSTTPVVCSDIRSIYERDLMQIELAYPESRQWLFDDHMWLLTKSQLTEDGSDPASFLIGITFTLPVSVKAWGFWEGVTPIGPRHTNYGDGSICAFNPADRSWKGGESLVPLLDMYSLWAFRHLHLMKFGYWPGRQHCDTRYERFIEVQDFELCGCGSNTKYIECCKASDQNADLLHEAISFNLRSNNGFRQIPLIVKQFVTDFQKPPPKTILLS